jgi:DNA-nicking Smr family endonuclease
MARRLAPEEKALWGRVMATVKPLHKISAVSPVPLKPVPAKPVASAQAGAAGSSARTPNGLRLRGSDVTPKAPVLNTLDATWDRRIHKGGVIPDISVDLHETTLSGAYARLDHTLEQAVHQKLRVVLLVTGHARAHDRASGQGRGAIAAVVRDWLSASRHAAAISAVRQAHPRHGGAGALYIILKR